MRDRIQLGLLQKAAKKLECSREKSPNREFCGFRFCEDTVSDVCQYLSFKQQEDDIFYPTIVFRDYQPFMDKVGYRRSPGQWTYFYIFRGRSFNEC